MVKIPEVQLNLLQGFNSLLGPKYKEALTTNDLFDTAALKKDLLEIDWAFEQENTSFLTHDIHPYPAKFIPHLPGTLIARLSLRGDLVLDPFGGSGTAALEAIRLGRRALILDANKVGILVGKVKTCRITQSVENDLHAIRTKILAHRQELPDSKEVIDRFAHLIPEIPNRSNWFPEQSCAELALIRFAISQAETSEACNIASIAMSRIILRASFQDSETRYTAKPRDIKPGSVLEAFVRAMDSVIRGVRETEEVIRYGVADFIEEDTRSLDPKIFPDQSVDMVITSPPYGNANDYHLYHRFRLFWLGADPRKLAKIEIGSHLRHQKENTGHDHYGEEMKLCMAQIARILRHSRYATFIMGDSIYKGNIYSGAELIRTIGTEVGLTHVLTINRPIHRTKRSFVAAGRRATTESIVILRRPPKKYTIFLNPPSYRLWPYETLLQKREIKALTGRIYKNDNGLLTVEIESDIQSKLRNLTFINSFGNNKTNFERAWQAVLENGLGDSESSRKEAKYATHGLHDYKGKFYPQLAKSLINISGVNPGSKVLDPFCGSGTTLLECYLNGLSAHGCDLNPMAAKIARAKVGILQLDPGLVSGAIETLIAKIDNQPSEIKYNLDQFKPQSHEEINSWFPKPVISKLNLVLKAIRSVSAGQLQDFLEVVLSNIVRSVSNQEPSDLRIRRRKKPLNDADVLGNFKRALLIQHERLIKFWSVRGHCPFPFYEPKVIEGDSRNWEAVETIGVYEEGIDLVLTSPPYATALPYIDTDRLSILLLFGLESVARRPIENTLTGSREITKNKREQIEKKFYEKASQTLPESVIQFVRDLYVEMTSAKVGFRRRNMPALLYRYFHDMQKTLTNVKRALKPGASAFVIMGDNLTSTQKKQILIPTTRLVADIAIASGLVLVEKIPITVTTENLVHIKNAIRENVVLHLKR